MLLVWGARYPFFPIEHARGMVGQFAGGAELVEVPGGKLFIHEDHHDAFAAHARTMPSRVLP